MSSYRRSPPSSRYSSSYSGRYSSSYSGRYSSSSNTWVVVTVAVIVILIAIGVAIYFLVDWYWPYTPPPEIETLKSRLSQVDPNFGRLDIRESGRESYTKRKSRIYLCMRDPTTHMIYDDNVLMYVALHECAHVLSAGSGHDAEFVRVFDSLLSRAESAGVYNSKIPFPKRYCGKDM